MSSDWLSMSVWDQRGATAMKYALVAVLLVLAVYHG
jgi:Flp pilus assembly pilin Flp